MKIGVVGCGALGSYYGAMLCRDGEEVHFLLRSDYEVVRQHGLRVQSPRGDFHVHPRCAKAPEEIGECDLVLIGLKTTANGAYPELLPPLVGDRTAVLTFQNGLGNEECVARLFRGEQILGGVCFVCLNRIKPGLVHHLDHGRIVLGEFGRRPEPRTEDIASIFQRAGVPCKVADDLEKARWEKLVWNIPFNGLGVAGTLSLDCVLSGWVPAEGSPGPVLTTDQLLANARWEAVVRELMSEVLLAANALGFPLPADQVEKNVARTRSMGAYKASTLIDFERGLPLELDSMFLEPMRRAERAGVSVPRLRALCAVLAHLDEGRMSRI